ncbi:MAG: DNA repair protein RecO [Bacteroidales bacterium]|nr:DNA repair protein RecO [Bacteroidales bacterium]
MLRKTEGIVLRFQKIADNRRIVNIFTRSSGKKAFVVYNSSKSKNNKINLFQPFFILNLEFNEKENSDFAALKEVNLAYPFQTIPYQVEKSSIVFFLTEIVGKIIEGNFVDERFFDFLKNSILLLDNHTKTANFHLSFLAAMSIYIGIMPDSNYSSFNKYFDLREGVFSSQFNNQFSMDEFTSRKFNEILEAGMQNFDEVKLVQAVRKMLLQKILDFYSFHFNNVQNLKSLEVLQEMYGE